MVGAVDHVQHRALAELLHDRPQPRERRELVARALQEQERPGRLREVIRALGPRLVGRVKREAEEHDPAALGQRLGGDRPDLAERSVYTGLRWNFGYTCGVASAYLLIPGVLVGVFEGGRDPQSFAAIARVVPSLLACAAVYSLADAVNLTFSFALRGAGDTRFVSLLTFALAWPIMVVPTIMVVRAGGNIYWAWCFATAYILAMAVCFSLRFRSGKWKRMRVIEAST